MYNTNYQLVINKRNKKLYNWIKRFFVILIVCFTESFFNGLLHVIFLYVSLPASDAAKQSGLLFFGDPFVLTMLFFVCTCIGFLATPVALLLFWNKNMDKVFLILTVVCVPLTILFSQLGTVATILVVGYGAILTSFCIHVCLKDLCDN
jgi:hypothetical protein